VTSSTALPTTDSLKDLQEYIWQMHLDRGFSDDPAKKMLMLTEEVGELAKAVRQEAGMGFTETTKRTETAEELADVLIVLLSLSSLLGVDIHQAALDKEGKNRKRVWE
jgi:NTP pyrophosphatase (non-canonical NTP hydrolase)